MNRGAKVAVAGLVAVAGAMLVVIVTGPALVPHDPLATVASPWSAPGKNLALGTDSLGRDVVARVLAGGRDLTLIALGAAVVASALGVLSGLWAGWSTGWATRLVRALADVALVLPPLLVVLVVSVILPGPAAVIVGTVATGAPLTLRLVGDATHDARQLDYVHAALLRGESTLSILLREVLPANARLVAGDLGLRTVVALQVTAALHLLGLGPAPPTPDWATMLVENLPGLGLNPAAVVAPALALAAVAGAVGALTHVVGNRSGAR
ncbi:MAG: ABC transporter permease subunit [Actinomycetota bacterium]|nr:ABC transporter permease subunit [Actinomycetota bacterium]